MEEWKTVGIAAKGTAIHFAKEGMARCDKSISLLVFDDGGKTAADITCAKCKKYKAYKDTIDTTKKKPLDLKPEKEIEIPAGKTELIPSDTKKRPKVKPVKPKEIVVETKEEPQKYDISIDEIDADFAGKKNKNGYSIVHIPTETVMFNGICQEVVEDALLNLNIIEERWPGKNSTIPKGFIAKCRKALGEAFRACKIEVPKSLDEKVPENKGRTKKPKKVMKKKFRKGDKKIINKKKVVYDGKVWIPETVRTIKRRKKAEPTKPKKIISRRVKIEKKTKPKLTIKRRNILGFRTSDPPGIIVKEMKKSKGTQHADLAKELKRIFNMSTTKTRSVIRRTIESITRGKGIEVVIIMGKRKKEDRYSIG